jgi:hypothetical protein
MMVFISAYVTLGINKTSRKEINAIRVCVDFINVYPSFRLMLLYTPTINRQQVGYRFLIELLNGQPVSRYVDGRFHKQENGNKFSGLTCHSCHPVIPEYIRDPWSRFLLLCYLSSIIIPIQADVILSLPKY